MKHVVIDEKTHTKLKTIADQHGLKMQHLANRILWSWLRGEVFFLPDALPVGTAHPMFKKKKEG